jgi:hypothetical protein
LASDSFHLARLPGIICSFHVIRSLHLFLRLVNERRADRPALLPHHHLEPIELREVSLIGGDLETVDRDVDDAKIIDLLEYVFGKP